MSTPLTYDQRWSKKRWSARPTPRREAAIQQNNRQNTEQRQRLEVWHRVVNRGSISKEDCQKFTQLFPNIPQATVHVWWTPPDPPPGLRLIPINRRILKAG